MDKLRAIQYFNRAVETGSFGAAARSLDVSTPAITHLIGALERALGVTLLHRTTRGISLTADGERYYAVSRTISANLADIEQQLGTRGSNPRGTLTVGMFGSIGHHCVMPNLGRFLARYPDVALSVKVLQSLEALKKESFDVAVMNGWAPEGDFAVRPLAQSRNVVCASPDYWARMGKPHVPEDLNAHHCIVFRSAGGAILDRWIFEKDGERRTIDVKSRLMAETATWADQAACAGIGVIRRADLALGSQLSSNALVPVLTDWIALDAPTHFVIYRRGRRQSRLVRVFIDFLLEIYTELEVAQRALFGSKVSRMPKPDWFGRAYGKQSEYVRHMQRFYRQDR